MSSTPNKRAHEEGGNGSGGHGHSSASKYQHEDSGAFPGMNAKIPSSSQSEYHAPYDIGQDSRMPKVPRTESREPDRRSPLLPPYRVSSSSNDSHSDHPAGFESRLEFWDSKDSNRDSKFENRDNKVESRDLYQGNKVDKDLKFEGRSDDGKETKYERDIYSEHRGDLKMDKDGYGGLIVHSNWKDAKEQHRGKRYPDASGGSVDPWHTSRSNILVSSEVGKEAIILEDKDYSEAREAVGENKLDMKGEEKFKDRDRKRKEGKHREWGGERDKDRNDRRNSLQIGTSNSNAENKDLVKEEREPERWEKERKDFSRDKDKVNFRGEKDHTKKESGSGAEKEGSYIEKELVDVPGRTSELDNSTLELKKLKESDGWKNADRDQRDRKKERDADIEGEKLEKRNRHHDKESDEGCGDAEGGTERDREAFGYGVQQRKRMLRPRGSPQLSNRDPRFRSRNHENEGSQGKPDMSTVVYRVGECMQDLIKLWKDYESSQVEKTAESSQNGPTLELRIPAEHVSATNRQVRGGQLWGTDIYTDDSDLVAVLMHTGYCRPTAAAPPATIQELRATIRVLPPQDCYISTLRNNVRSRAWGAAIGCSYHVERCCIVKKGGGTIDLEPCLTHSSTLEPTLAPVAVERTMTTRAAASNALRQQRFVREVTIQFNLCSEPWLKYSISVIADKGLKKPLYTSSRLKKGEVLYLETHSRRKENVSMEFALENASVSQVPALVPTRYELSFSGEKMVKAGIASLTLEAESERSQTHSSHPTNGDRGIVDGDTIVIDVFRWSRCKKPLPQKHMRTIGIPLPLEHVEVVEENLEWEDIRWSSTGVWIAGVEYPLARAHFLSPN